MFAMRAILLLSNLKRARTCYYRKPLLCNTVVFVFYLSNKAEVVAILKNKPNAELMLNSDLDSKTLDKECSGRNAPHILGYDRGRL